MNDRRNAKLARILVEHSMEIQPGERVGIWATTAAEPLIEAIYTTVLEYGGEPHLILDLPEQDRLLLEHGKSGQVDALPIFRHKAVTEFDGYVKIRSHPNPHQLDAVDPALQARREGVLAPLLRAQLDRGASRALKWVVTLYPTEGYARDAGMSLPAFTDFVYAACHADDDTEDPVAYWREVRKKQTALAARFEGHDRVELRGPEVDLRLSIKGRKFMDASGMHNIPDGEIYTGPVEDSAQGWVRFTYPAVKDGRAVEGVELRFEGGRVVEARARKNEAFLHEMLNLDPGARYLGEFAIGNNFQIQQFTGDTLFDEKIGGTFHLALGAGYPETGSHNDSKIHWDMVCDMRNDSEILVDGEVVYRNGAFLD